MRLINEVETVRLDGIPGPGIEARVRVRGLDALRSGRGALVRRQEPLGVSTPGGEFIPMPCVSFGPPGWLYVAIPAASLVLGRVITRAMRKGAR
jgi:hypothetical protein